MADLDGAAITRQISGFDIGASCAHATAPRPGSSQPGITAHLKVSVRGPVYSWDIPKMEVAVRAASVSRVVLAERAKGPLEPGTITYLDGRRVKVKAMRWTTWGIRALTEEDIVIARWSDLAEVHPPRVDVIDALIDDLTAPCSDPESLFARLITEHGAVLTYRHKMMQIDHKEAAYGGLHHTVQPGWALDAIRVAFDSISKRSFWRADEIPLSLLPAQTLSERSYTGFTWHWRRNTNVRGTDLFSGRFAAHLGIGTHSASQISFQLPPGAKQLSSWVGIDRAVGNGGCAAVELYRDKVKGKSIWKSDFLRGGNDPVRLNAINIEYTKRPNQHRSVEAVKRKCAADIGVETNRETALIQIGKTVRVEIPLHENERRFVPIRPLLLECSAREGRQPTYVFGRRSKGRCNLGQISGDIDQLHPVEQHPWG